MSWRTARIYAMDVRAGDQLITSSGSWEPVTEVNTEDASTMIRLAGAAEPFRYASRTPLLVRWEVPSTTFGMRGEQRRDQ